MKCNQCGHENIAGAKFCDKCGASLSAEVMCPECGHMNRADAKFCKECGASFTGGAASAPAAAKKAAKKVRRAGLPTWARILIGLIGLATFIGGGLKVFQGLTGINLLDLLPWSQQASAAAEPKVTKVVYTTNPATVIEQDTPMVLVFDWLAKTKEQVQAFIDNAVQEVNINGTPVVAKVTYSVVTTDPNTGGFKTQVTAEIGNLPVGTNEVKTILSFKQQISDGTKSYGPGTDNERVEKTAKIIVEPVSYKQASSDNSGKSDSTGSCPLQSDITAGELTWEGDTPYILVENKLGWEPYEEAPANPPIFSSAGYMWAHPICKVTDDDNTILACTAEFDQPAPDKQNIGLYLPYPWSKAEDKFCYFEEKNLTIAAAQCPPEEDIQAGEIYWQEGFAKIPMYNPNGWEPYAEMPDNPSILTVEEELYTEVDCEVDRDDNTIMLCSGVGTVKTGGIGMALVYPWQGTFCVAPFEQITIKNICPPGTTHCVYTGQCCSGDKQCTVNGCMSPEPAHDDDHH